MYWGGGGGQEVQDHIFLTKELGRDEPSGSVTGVGTPKVTA